MPSARLIADALADSPAGHLLARLALCRRLAANVAPLVAQIAPDFDATDPGAINLRENVLLLSARSSAQAAKLRQGVPGLLRLLHQQGFQVSEIRVRVQPALTSYPEQTTDRGTQVPRESAETIVRRSEWAHADAGARRFADRLAEGLPEGPLRDAARRLRKSLSPKAPT